MENPEARRLHIKELLAARCEPEVAARLVALLQPLYGELASLVSELGVDVLLERSLYQTGQAFPWFDAGTAAAGAARWDGLRAALAPRTHEEALEASTYLLLNFVDLVASLIGESLTVGILQAAWGNNARGILGEDYQA